MPDPAATATAALVRQLREDVHGQVIDPQDPEYDDGRTVYYTGIDRRPAVIVRPLEAVGVARVVSHAREAGVPLAVRSGGHSLGGHGVVDDGIVLDLSAMRRLELEPVGHTAWAETGLTAGEYTKAAGAYGLATGFGDAPSVGIGGITLGGGVGFLHRKYGLTIDNLLAAELVTADGELLYTDADAHPDLFWAIRGGGGNFGVATRFRYRLAEVEEVMGGMLILPATPERIADLVEVLTEASDGLSGMVNVMVAPPMPMLPDEVHGQLIAMTYLMHSGPSTEAEREFARIRAIAPPVVDMVDTVLYRDIYEAGEPPHPSFTAVRTMFRDGIDRAAAEVMVEGLRRSTAPMRVAQIRVLGGAVARVPADATAFAHRQRGMMVTVAAMYEQSEAGEEHQAWADDLAGELRQGEAGAYVGFMGDEGADSVRAAYPPATWDRLVSIKGRYDPTNLFRLNQNVPPATSAAGR